MKFQDPHSEKLKCPHTRRRCMGAECAYYVLLRGTDAQGDEVDHGVCAPVASLAFTMQNGRQLDGIQKGVEGQRNATLSGIDHLATLSHAAKVARRNDARLSDDRSADARQLQHIFNEEQGP